MYCSIRIGGEAGQGIQTVGDTLARVFSRSGYHVFTWQDYESRIRGGHNFYQVQVSDSRITAPDNSIDILVAFDSEAISSDAGLVRENGYILYDSTVLKGLNLPGNQINIPFAGLAVEHGGSRIMANTVAVGAVLGMLGADMDVLLRIISDTFGGKGSDTVRTNSVAANAGYDHALRSCSNCSPGLSSVSVPKMLISGIDAIGFGAAASGCRFYSAYPMTPSTGIMNYLASKEKDLGIIVEQAEDEIAAINMAIGASFGGVRSMTASSGGGFALMVEGLSLAAMTETPIVIGLGQRPGPATGLPTRTEQGDLNFALYTAHGEFPRIIFAPGDPEQAVYLTSKAFDLAEKYQVPAIVLFDTFLADTQWTYDGIDLTKIVYNDHRLRSEDLAALHVYDRHVLTADGVSPMAVPGGSEHVVVTDSDEHTEDGHITEDAVIRRKMVEKRLFAKLPLIKNEISPPSLYGDNDPEILLVGWGSTFGVIRSVADILQKHGRKAAMLHFSELYPFPSETGYLSLLKKARTAICIENNATGQFNRLLRTETGFRCGSEIHKFDGRPFTVEGLLGEVNALI